LSEASASRIDKEVSLSYTIINYENHGIFNYNDSGQTSETVRWVIAWCVTRVFPPQEIFPRRFFIVNFEGL